MFSKKWLFSYFIVTTLSIIPIHNADAHCDTLDGPVVKAAESALKSGDVTPVLKWVSLEDEAMIRTAFNKTLIVRKQSAEARSLADMYFFETLVRIHRASEGAPYTGLQPSNTTSPIILLTDQAIQSGSANKLNEAILHKLTNKLNKGFEATKTAYGKADQSVEDGRHYVKEYVEFTHFVEAVYQLLGDSHNKDAHSEH